MYSSGEEIYNITLAVFSGRPDPEWTATLVNDPIKNVISYDPRDIPPRLGYKGFIVQSTKKVRLIVGPETKQLQLELLNTMPQKLLPPGLVKEIRSEIKSGAIKSVTSSVRLSRNAPPYEPLQWQGPRRRLCNNCYNYANNIATDNFAQPGYGKGNPPQGLTFGQRIRNRSLLDGLTLAPNVPNNGIPGQPHDNRHVVALVVRPG